MKRRFKGIDGRYYEYAEFHVVPGTEGLLAVSREKGVDWTVTHVESNYHFPDFFDRIEDAYSAAMFIWNHYPRRKLKCKAARDVVRGMDKSAVRDLMHGNVRRLAYSLDLRNP